MHVAQQMLSRSGTWDIFPIQGERCKGNWCSLPIWYWRQLSYHTDLPALTPGEKLFFKTNCSFLWTHQDGETQFLTKYYEMTWMQHGLGPSKCLLPFLLKVSKLITYIFQEVLGDRILDLSLDSFSWDRPTLEEANIKSEIQIPFQEYKIWWQSNCKVPRWMLQN